MASNRFKVPKKQWRKWTAEAQELFNEIHTHMRDQRIYKHPDAPVLSTTHWYTTRWNAAWMAADMLSHGAKAREYKVVDV